MNIQTYVRGLEQLAREDSVRAISKVESDVLGRRGLFIDCGSNLGQGFQQFKQYYPIERFDYILVEPNPHCWPTLDNFRGTWPNNIRLLREAASTKAGVVQFFGLERDPTSQGASTIREHNSKYYIPDDEKALNVPCFSLADLIFQERLKYSSIILKLDIEGGEYEVLPSLIDRSAHKMLDAAYIEFHSQYMAEPVAQKYLDLEVQLKKRLIDDGVPLRIWI